MGKSNRLLMKMIKASGGWENFLYETLKEVCSDVGNNGFTGAGEDAIDDALEIIEAYEEQQGVASTPLEKPITNVMMPKVEVDPIGLDKIQSLAKLVEVKPKLIKAKIAIDGYVGGSQGTFPVPQGCQIVNKDKIAIMTVGGIELGRCNEDGQVRSPDVSGQIASRGDFRLVFKEVALGTAYVDFEVLPIPPAPAPMEISSNESLQKVSQVTPGMVAARAAETTKNASRLAEQKAAVNELAGKSEPVDPPRNADGSNVKQMG